MYLENHYIELSNKIIIIKNIEDTLNYKFINENIFFIKLIDLIVTPFKLNLYSFILINKGKFVNIQ